MHFLEYGVQKNYYYTFAMPQKTILSHNEKTIAWGKYCLRRTLIMLNYFISQKISNIILYLKYCIAVMIVGVALLVVHDGLTKFLHIMLYV